MQLRNFDVNYRCRREGNLDGAGILDQELRPNVAIRRAEADGVHRCPLDQRQRAHGLEKHLGDIDGRP